MHKLALPDQLLSRLQDNIVAALLPLEGSPLYRVVVVRDVAIGTSSTEIAHGLGYMPTGYIVVKRSANATVYDGAAHSTPSMFINLTASSAVTVTLLVF